VIFLQNINFISTFEQLTNKLFKMECTEMHDALGYKIVYSGKLLIKKINSRFTAFTSDLSFDQLAILHFLSLNESHEIIQQDIAIALDKTKSAILKTIDILEQKKYLKRVPAPEDRRKNVIELTPAGNKIIEAVHKLYMEEEEYITKGISKKDLEVCMRVLDQIKTRCKN
jgi:DNA-binding MarR family transcriptional regulator